MRVVALLVIALISAGRAGAQDGRAPVKPGQGPPGSAGEAAPGEDRVRARFRTGVRSAGTKVDQTQAEMLTLTLGEVSSRPVQTWIRTAGTIDRTGRVIEAFVAGSDAGLVKPGQRVRAFPPSSRFSMYQAFVTRVVPRRGGLAVDVSLASSGRPNARLYVIEIVVERGPFLSVPNEAIIEEGDRHIVYVQQQPGQYLPRQIATGIQGELYTQVVDGVKDGDQVVTFGSFFIDAEQKLKGTAQLSPPPPPR
jgi:hypothetical protein